MADITLNAPNTKQFYLGNEAIARGALEAGIGFASAYPGTPSSEIMGSLAPVAKKMGIYAEWSVNEIVAMESAAGASFAGIRALTAMKQNGVDVTSDFLVSLGMSGIGKGGLVLVSCDDPGSLSSPYEQDTRTLARAIDIPVLEPGSFQEAKDMTRWLFDLSEELGTLCMLRSVTRIAHARGGVTLGKLPHPKFAPYFDQAFDVKAPMVTKYMTVPLARHAFLHMKLHKAAEIFEKSPFNWYVGPDKADLLIITAGSGWLYAQDAVKALKLEDRVGILKLGTIWPMPEKLIAAHLKKSQKVLFVEEIESFIESNVMELMANLPASDHKTTLFGKRSGHFNNYGELDPDLVINAVARVLGLKYESRNAQYEGEAIVAVKQSVPERSLAFCAGCPHRASFWAIKNAIMLDGRNGFVAGDIGCYYLAVTPTGFSQARTAHCMGAGTGIANGFGQMGRYGFKQPVISVVGDSTFFHATIPALINGIYHHSNFTLVILDNSATSMTGFQPNPGTQLTAMGEPAKTVNMDALCRAIGAEVMVSDPFDLKGTTSKLLDLMSREDGARVLILRRECELVRAKKEKRNTRMLVDPDKCLGENCGCNRVCTRKFGCPGLVWDKEAGKSRIDDAICAACGLCVDICPAGAIQKEIIQNETAKK